MNQLLKKEAYKVTFNLAFAKVIENCANQPRAGQEGTWITQEMKNAYSKLHEIGYAQSVEVWENHQLVGGLYGIYLRDQGVFCGESMFTKKSNASKYGFIKLVQKLQKEGVHVIDCQVYTAHLESLGAEEIPREDFLKLLTQRK